MRRAGLLLVAGAAGLTLIPQAVAGSYEVVGCDSAPGGASHAWAGAGDASPHYEVAAVCPVGGDRFAGLRAWDQIGSANAPDGSEAGWTFGAPGGTVITGWRYKRWLGKDGSNSWDVHARLGDGTRLDSCTIPFGLPSCEVGAPAGTNEANERNATGLSTDSLHFGITCAAGPGITCATGGATIHNAWAHLYSSTVTLSESVAPTISPVAGTLAGGGWRRGSESVELSGSDGVGVSETHVYLGGSLVSSSARSCDFAHSLPCVDPPCSPAAGGSCGDPTFAVTHTLDTTAVSDGQHALEVAAVDAAGNEARSAAVTVSIDNSAPAFSISAPAGETSGEQLSVSWSSDDGSGSGVSGHDVEVSIDGGGWQAWLAGTTASSATYPASPGHAYRFRGRASDVSGLGSSWVTSAESRVVAAPAACACPPASPQPPPGAVPPAGDDEPAPARRRTPFLRMTRARRGGRRVAVRGTISRAASGRVTITYSARAGRRRIRTRRTVRVRRGRFAAGLRLSRRFDRAAHGLVTLAYLGDDGFRPRSVRSRRIARGR